MFTNWEMYASIRLDSYLVLYERGMQMSRYEKPMVKVNEEVAEGVYAASGATNVRFELVGSESDGTLIYRVYVDNTTGGMVDGMTINGNFGAGAVVTETEATSAGASSDGGYQFNYSNKHLNPNDTNTDCGIVKVTGGTGEQTYYGTFE